MMPRPKLIIPLRSFDTGKRRLASVLSHEDKRNLIRSMFDHVLSVAAAVVPAKDIVVATSDQEAAAIARSRGHGVSIDAGEDLNLALEAATKLMADCVPLAGVLVLHADLPRIAPADIHAIIDASGPNRVVAAADRRNRGTNALLVRPMGLVPYVFGVGSLGRFHAAAAEAGADFLTVNRLGLGFDLDTREDLAEGAAAEI